MLCSADGFWAKFNEQCKFKTFSSMICVLSYYGVICFYKSMLYS